MMRDLGSFGFLLSQLWPVTSVLAVLCIAGAFWQRNERKSWVTYLPYLIAVSHVLIGLGLKQEKIGPPSIGAETLNALALIAVLISAAYSVFRAQSYRFSAASHSALAIWVAMSFAFTAQMLISTGCEDL